MLLIAIAIVCYCRLKPPKPTQNNMQIHMNMNAKRPMSSAQSSKLHQKRISDIEPRDIERNLSSGIIPADAEASAGLKDSDEEVLNDKFGGTIPSPNRSNCIILSNQLDPNRTSEQCPSNLSYNEYASDEDEYEDEKEDFDFDEEESGLCQNTELTKQGVIGLSQRDASDYDDDDYFFE